MYEVGKSVVGAGTRTSPSAKAAPAGGFGGVMVTRARNGEVPLGAGSVGRSRCCRARARYRVLHRLR